MERTLLRRRGGRDGFLLVRPAPAAAVTRVEALGRSASGQLDERWITLSPRHSELFLVLALRPGGMTAEELTLAVWGERAKPINARAELSRLRRVLGSRLEASPYRLRGEIRTDVDELDAAARAGPARGGARPLRRARCCRARRCRSSARRASCSTSGLRNALLARRTPALLERWLTNPSGRTDAQACHELLALLPEGDPRREAALSHLRRITAER